MKQAFYSEKLDKFFKTEKECLEAEKAVCTEESRKSAAKLQARINLIANSASEFVKDLEDHLKKYGSIELTIKIGDRTYPISIEASDLDYLKEQISELENVTKRLDKLLGIKNDSFFPSFEELFG